METLERNEWADVAQLVEITSDAVIICELDGTILHVNNRLLGLMCEERADVIGGDVKDVLYSSAFERATEHRLPFETDGSENELMLKLSDGSFIPRLGSCGLRNASTHLWAPRTTCPGGASQYRGTVFSRPSAQACVIGA